MCRPLGVLVLSEDLATQISWEDRGKFVYEDDSRHNSSRILIVGNNEMGAKISQSCSQVVVHLSGSK
jgi:hypothetical protein